MLLYCVWRIHAQTAGGGTDLLFPYVLTAKSGMSRALMDTVHDGIMSTSGLTDVLNSLRRKRHNRYYFLRPLFAMKCDAGDLMQFPPSLEQYGKEHSVPDHQSVTDRRMPRTIPHCLLSEGLMRSQRLERVVRIDYSQ